MKFIHLFMKAVALDNSTALAKQFPSLPRGVIEEALRKHMDNLDQACIALTMLCDTEEDTVRAHLVLEPSSCELLRQPQMHLIRINLWMISHCQAACCSATDGCD